MAPIWILMTVAGAMLFYLPAVAIGFSMVLSNWQWG